MLTHMHLFSDADGRARFADRDVPLLPEDPAPDQLAMSAPLAASAVVFVRAPAGGSHPEQPESR
jgi:hypothetical protein